MSYLDEKNEDNFVTIRLPRDVLHQLQNGVSQDEKTQEALTYMKQVKPIEKTEQIIVKNQIQALKEKGYIKPDLPKSIHIEKLFLSKESFNRYTFFHYLRNLKVTEMYIIACIDLYVYGRQIQDNLLFSRRQNGVAGSLTAWIGYMENLSVSICIG